MTKVQKTYQQQISNKAHISEVFTQQKEIFYLGNFIKKVTYSTAQPLTSVE